MPIERITRRGFLRGAAAAPALAARPLRSAERPPNIIFVLCDDQRWDTLGAMGNRIIQTPHLDDLSRRGVLFTNNFCTSAVCQTSRASMLSGLYEQAHKVIYANETLSPKVFAQTFPVLLRKAGYYTGFIGKWHFGQGKPFPKEELFDVYKGFFGQGIYFPEGPHGPHLTHLLGQEGIDFLHGRPKDQPFCLFLSFKAPHPQEHARPYHGQFLNAPEYDHLYDDVTIPYPKSGSQKCFELLPDFIQHSELRVRWEDLFSTPERYQHSMKGYYRLITGVDAQIGRINDALRELNQDGNTVIAHTGDNGYFLAEHGLADKSLMYEPSIRTPLLVYDPRLTGAQRGQRRRDMVLNIDLAPTFLDLAGVRVPDSMQGRSLVPLMTRRARSWRREWLYQHNFNYEGAIPASEGIRTERWKYIRYVDRKPLFEQLFDLQRDPDELDDLARKPAFAARLDELRKRWQTWHDSVAGWRLGHPWHEPA